MKPIPASSSYVFNFQLSIFNSYPDLQFDLSKYVKIGNIYWRIQMTLCPYSALSSCSKCPIKKVCLLKGVIGDYKKPEETKKENKK